MCRLLRISSSTFLLALFIFPLCVTKGCWNSIRSASNRLRIHQKARRPDAAESGIVSNAFVHSLSRWQTLRNGWNPSLVKLAHTPGFLDFFHFRELCHMLAVNHEALLPQSWGVGREASARTGVDLKENRVGGEAVWKSQEDWDILPVRQPAFLEDPAPEAIREDHYTHRLFSLAWAHILQLISLAWHLPSMNHPRDLQQHTHTHSSLSPLLSAPGGSSGMFAPPS